MGFQYFGPEIRGTQGATGVSGATGPQGATGPSSGYPALPSASGVYVLTVGASGPAWTLQ